jgi:conjugal transfer pilus assembly protein TraV
MRNKNIIGFVLSITFLLSGCEMMNSSYDCPLSEGASCMALHDMDAAVTRGEYPKNIRNNISESGTYVQHKDLMPGTYPSRTKDRVAKIWLAPYEDNSGNYHEQSNIYTVVENSGWSGAPISAPSIRNK